MAERETVRVTQEKRPNITLYYPDWWHGHGNKMRVVEQDEEGVVVIKSRVAKVRIKYSDKHPDYPWQLSWEIGHGLDVGEETSGILRMKNDELRAAFGLQDIIEHPSQWMIDRFGGTVASQGKFIRYKDFLNIPMPGSGHDGDPNVSIELDDEIRLAVLAFIQNTRQKILNNPGSE